LARGPIPFASPLIIDSTSNRGTPACIIGLITIAVVGIMSGKNNTPGQYLTIINLAGCLGGPANARTPWDPDRARSSIPTRVPQTQRELADKHLMPVHLFSGHLRLRKRWKAPAATTLLCWLTVHSREPGFSLPQLTRDPDAQIQYGVKLRIRRPFACCRKVRHKFISPQQCRIVRQRGGVLPCR